MLQKIEDMNRPICFCGTLKWHVFCRSVLARSTNSEKNEMWRSSHCRSKGIRKRAKYLTRTTENGVGASLHTIAICCHCCWQSASSYTSQSRLKAKVYWLMRNCVSSCWNRGFYNLSSRSDAPLIVSAVNWTNNLPAVLLDQNRLVCDVRIGLKYKNIHRRLSNLKLHCFLKDELISCQWAILRRAR